MNWMQAVDALFKVKSIVDAGKQCKDIADYAQKIDTVKKGKQSWDELKPISNSTMTKATAKIRKADAEVDAALKGEMKWPDMGTMQSFLGILHSIDKYGEDSPKTKAAVTTYKVLLVAWEGALKATIIGLEARSGDIAHRAAQAKALRDYAHVVEKACLDACRIPSIVGTAPQASMFALSQDLSQFGGIAGDVHRKYIKLGAKNAELIAEGKTILSDNKSWIGWAKSQAPFKPGNVKRNLKAKHPH